MLALGIYGILFAGCLGGYFYLKKKSIHWKYKKYLPILGIISVLCFVVGTVDLVGKKQPMVSYLERNRTGEGVREEQLILNAEDVLSQYDYCITVEEQLLTDAEIQKIFEDAEKELERVILGENLSAERISSDLEIPVTLADGRVEVSCYFDPYELIEEDGTILWENMNTKTSTVEVSATMYCQDMEASHEFYLQLVAPQLPKEEELLKKIKNNLEKENKSYGQDKLKLPAEVNGVSLEWHRVAEQNHLKVFVLGILVLVLGYVYEKDKKEKEKKNWEQGLMRDYPDIVSQLSLLSGAGMTISSAWEKIVLEYRIGREKENTDIRPGYEEMLKTWHEMKDGIGDVKAYENFGRRCNQSVYRKFASLLMQNVRKGTKGMQELLDMEAREAFQLRKVYAKQKGEEAGTKLLIPMGLMLLLVFAIIMLPAMLSLNLS